MIETTNSSISYIADGIQTEWNYPYTFIKPEDIELYVTIENVRTKISSDDFSIDTETGVVTYPLSGDPVPALAIVEIVRNTEITQLEDSSIVAFKSNDVERIADKLTMICQDKYTLVKKYEEHILDTNNPHNVTKAQVGLGNVDNTSDLDKPVSTATQTALNAKQDVGDYATNSALIGFASTDAEIMVVHSSDDSIVPIEYGYDIYYDAFKDDSRFTFIRLEGKGHNQFLNVDQNKDLYESFVEFYDENLF